MNRDTVILDFRQTVLLLNKLRTYDPNGCSVAGCANKAQVFIEDTSKPVKSYCLPCYRKKHRRETEYLKHLVSAYIDRHRPVKISRKKVSEIFTELKGYFIK